jgi:hypothetical protein
MIDNPLDRANGHIVIRRYTHRKDPGKGAVITFDILTGIGLTRLGTEAHRFNKKSHYSKIGRKVHKRQLGPIGEPIVDALLASPWVGEVTAMTSRKVVLTIPQVHSSRVRETTRSFVEAVIAASGNHNVQLVNERGAELRWGR